MSKDNVLLVFKSNGKFVMFNACFSVVTSSPYWNGAILDDGADVGKLLQEIRQQQKGPFPMFTAEAPTREGIEKAMQKFESDELEGPAEYGRHWFTM